MKISQFIKQTTGKADLAKQITREDMNAMSRGDDYIADDKNPAFALGGVDSEFLALIAQGKIDAQELAKRILENRGENIHGEWVGFSHKIK